MSSRRWRQCSLPVTVLPHGKRPLVLSTVLCTAVQRLVGTASSSAGLSSDFLLHHGSSSGRPLSACAPTGSSSRCCCWLLLNRLRSDGLASGSLAFLSAARGAGSTEPVTLRNLLQTDVLKKKLTVASTSREIQLRGMVY